MAERAGFAWRGRNRRVNGRACGSVAARPTRAAGSAHGAARAAGLERRPDPSALVHEHLPPRIPEAPQRIEHRPRRAAGPPDEFGCSPRQTCRRTSLRGTGAHRRAGTPDGRRRGRESRATGRRAGEPPRPALAPMPATRSVGALQRGLARVSSRDSDSLRIEREGRNTAPSTRTYRRSFPSVNMKKG